MPRMIKACLLQIPYDIRRLWIRRVWLTKYLSTPLAVMASVCTISWMLENGRKSCLPGWTIRRIEFKDRKSVVWERVEDWVGGVAWKGTRIRREQGDGTLGTR